MGAFRAMDFFVWILHPGFVPPDRGCIGPASSVEGHRLHFFFMAAGRCVKLTWCLRGGGKIHDIARFLVWACILRLALVCWALRVGICRNQGVQLRPGFFCSKPRWRNPMGKFLWSRVTHCHMDGTIEKNAPPAREGCLRRAR